MTPLPPLVTAIFPGTADQVCQARAFVRKALDDARYKSVIDDAELLTSELFTNATRHSRSRQTGSVTVIVLADESVRVEVVDEGSAISVPRVGSADTFALGGRGLLLVREISTRFGVRNDAGGTAIWFELRP